MSLSSLSTLVDVTVMVSRTTGESSWAHKGQLGHKDMAKKAIKTRNFVKSFRAFWERLGEGIINLKWIEIAQKIGNHDIRVFAKEYLDIRMLPPT
jgi:hypothetical protein